MLGDEKVEKNISFAQKMFVWLQDEQHLVESIPTTPTNLMKIIPEAIYSLLLIKNLVSAECILPDILLPQNRPVLSSYTESLHFLGLL